MDFIKFRKKSYIISGTLLLLSVISFFALPLNFGIDMTGGIQLEYTVDTVPARSELNALQTTVVDEFKHEDKNVLNDLSIYAVAGVDAIRLETGFEGDFTEVEFEEVKTTLRNFVPTVFEDSGITASEDKYVNIGKSFGDYVKKTAYFTLILSVILIALYVAWVFRRSTKGINSMSYGLITVVTLFHDVVIASGIYVFVGLFFPELKVDTFFITALLTILGYSINDTIVVLDRVRSTLKSKKSGQFAIAKVLNDSIRGVLYRSLYTSITLLIVLISLFFFGPDTLRGFVFALILGTVIGTYSSIMLAAPMVSDFYNPNKK